MGLMTINWNPTRKQSRQFGLAGLAVFGALGAWALLRHRVLGFELPATAALATGLALCSLAAACGMLAVAAPQRLRRLYVALTVITFPIGVVVSHVIIAVLFYLVFTPVALFFRLVGRDALHRKPEPCAKTYWTERKPVMDMTRYFRQA